MCKMASFWHNPNNGDIVVYDLMSHSDTHDHLKLDKKWREGHYTPDGKVECRVEEKDRITEEDCGSRLLNRFPTFKDFLLWVLNQSIGGYLDLSGCDLKGIKFPESIGGSLDLSGCDLKGIKLPENVAVIK